MIAQCENHKAVRATIIEPAWLKNGLSAQTDATAARTNFQFNSSASVRRSTRHAVPRVRHPRIY
jgi:hypothetical protein